ncbi:MAG: EF-P lysine aminoacylase EpmA [Pirellulales bacterium]
MNFDFLRRRAELLDRLRQFFCTRGFLEVETPLVLPEVIPELHIEPIRTADGQFLQASPELAMKRLLAAGSGPIFQVTRSFRAGECGPLHRPEFTIVEWYRPGDGMAAGILLLEELLHALVPEAPRCARTSYRQAFLRVLDIDPHSATDAQLATVSEEHAVAKPQAMDYADRDEWLNLLLATRIEPQLGISEPEILYHYPASQASLSATTTDAHGAEVAERFELYWKGIELANGFHELTDAAVLRERLTHVNAARVADGRDALPLPESLLAAMERGLPQSCGVALGFDRLVMVAVGAKTIDDVLRLPQAMD